MKVLRRNFKIGIIVVIILCLLFADPLKFVQQATAEDTTPKTEEVLDTQNSNQTEENNDEIIETNEDNEITKDDSSQEDTQTDVTQDAEVKKSESVNKVYTLSVNTLDVGDEITSNGLIFEVISSSSVAWVGYEDETAIPSEITVPSEVVSDGVTYKVTTVSSDVDISAAKSAVTKVELPDTVSVIEDNAFNGYSKLTTINLGKVESIGIRAFSSCSVLSGEIDLSSATTLGSTAFSSCKMITSVIFADGLKTIPSYCFSNAAIESLNLPDSVEEIGESAFQTNRQLTELNINVKSIQTYAFRMCTNLTKLTLGEKIESIYQGAFFYDTKLADVEVKKEEELVHFLKRSGTTYVDIDFTEKNSSHPFYGCPALASDIPTGEEGANGADDPIRFAKSEIEQGQTLQDMIYAVMDGTFEDGTTITLNKNYKLTEPLYIKNKDKDVDQSTNHEVTLTSTDGITITQLNEIERLINISEGYTLIIDGNITLDGMYCSSETAGNIFDIQGKLVFNSGTITNIKTSDSALHVYDSGVFEMNGGSIKNGVTLDGNRCGIVKVENGGTFTMNGGEICDHAIKAVSSVFAVGGTVLVEQNGQFNFNGGEIHDNKIDSTSSGLPILVTGGVCLYSDTETAKMYMNDDSEGKIYSNHAFNGGGVLVCGSSSFIMKGGEISKNTVDPSIGGQGGGVCVYDLSETSKGTHTCEFILDGGTISNNKVFSGGDSSTPMERRGGSGGGIYIDSQNVQLLSGKVLQNQSRVQGGGIYVEDGVNNCLALIKNALVINNSASVIGGGVWICPTGSLNNKDGGYYAPGIMMYDNYAGEAMDFHYAGVSYNTKGEVNLSNHFYNGTWVTWYNEKTDKISPQIIHANQWTDLTAQIDPNYKLSNDEINEKVNNHELLLVEFNSSQEKGGGIAANSGIDTGDVQKGSLKINKNIIDQNNDALTFDNSTFKFAVTTGASSYSQELVHYDRFGMPCLLEEKEINGEKQIVAVYNDESNQEYYKYIKGDTVYRFYEECEMMIDGHRVTKENVYTDESYNLLSDIDTNDLQIVTPYIEININGESTGSTVIENLETGNYLVTEVSHSDHEHYNFVSVTSDKNDNIVTVVDEQETPITFTNKYEEIADLSLSKTVTGSYADTDKEFTFTVHFYKDNTKAEELDRTFTYMIGDDKATITSGGTLTLKHGQTAIIKDLPVDSYYTISETAVAGYTSNHENGESAGIISEETNSVSYENTYNPQDGTVQITGNKILTGRQWLDDDSFQFSIEGYDQKTKDAIENNNISIANDTSTVSKDQQSYKFDLTFKTTGEYNFVVKEVQDDKLSGITYDEHSYIVNVKVTNDNSKGQLIAEITSSTGEADFENTYQAKETVYPVEGSKELTGRKDDQWLDTDQFTFVLSADMEDADTKNAIESGNVSLPQNNEVTVNSQNRNFKFDNIIFKQTGTYQFIVTEKDEGIQGITYDTHEYIVKIQVTDNNKGQLIAKLTDDTDTTQSVFKNAYSITGSTEDSISGTKNLTGKELGSNEFTFKLTTVSSKDSDGNDITAPVPEKGTEIKNTDGTFDFGKITFTQEGTYVYRVEEVNEGKTGYTYDDSSYEVTFTVTDNNNGGLSVTKTITHDNSNVNEIIFNNSYKALPAEFELPVTKTVTNDSGSYVMKGGEFEFRLTPDKDNPEGDPFVNGRTVMNDENGKVNFGKVTYTKEGTYQYTVQEIKPENMIIGMNYDGSKYEVTVTVTDEEGQLKAVPQIKIEDKEYSGITFDNIYSITSKSVTKKWTDNSDQDGIRPESITVQLYADGEKYGEEVILSGEGDEWTYTWNGLPKKSNGQDIVYTVKEVGTSQGYTTSYSEDTFMITNTHTPEVISQTVTKKWTDNSDQDGIRPGSITVQLYADGEKYGEEVILTGEGDEWTYTWNDLPKKANGEDIIYTVQEVGTSQGYTTSYSEDTFMITNAHTPEVTSQIVTKKWTDNSDQDGIRPENITVQLYADGQKYGEEVILTGEGDEWTYTWNDLPKYKDGTEIKYTVKEMTETDDYTTSYSEDTLTITNAHTPEVISLSGMKKWNDNDNQDGIRPDEVTVRLYADGVEKDSQIVSAESEWKYSFNDLPKYKNHGQIINYTVREDSVDSYSTDYDKNDIINSYTPQVTSKTVTKVWDDNNDQDGLRKDILVQLLSNGKEYGEPVVLNKDNSWTYTWKDLPQKSNGQDITYTVQEIDKIEGYETSYSDDTFIITNKHTPATVDLPVSKQWSDNNDQDGLRKEVVVKLLADGKDTGKRMILDESNEWKAVFSDLDKYDQGHEISYTVEEESIKGYEAQYDYDDEGVIIINRHEAEKIDIPVTKIWNDKDETLRPRSITVHLLKDGTEIDSQVLTAENGWKYIFTDLDRYENGEEIKYTVTEDKVANYSTVINEYEITNSEIRGSITIKKISNAETPKETKFTVTGPDSYSKTITYSEFKDGIYTLDDLKLGTYKVTESQADKTAYILTVSGNSQNVALTEEQVEGNVEITNHYEPTETVINKLDNFNKPLANARLQIKEGNKVIEEWVSSSKAYVIKAKLEKGKEYTLHEVSAPSGYQKAKDITFKLGADGKASVTMIDIKIPDVTVKPSLVLYKVDQGEQFLTGASFKLVKVLGEEEVLVDTMTGGPKFEFKDLDEGIYRVYEIIAPEGYTGLDTYFEITVRNGNLYYEGILEHTFTIYNTDDGSEPEVLGDEVDEEEYKKWVKGDETEENIKTSDDQNIIGYGSVSMISILVFCLLKKKGKLKR